MRCGCQTRADLHEAPMKTCRRNPGTAHLCDRVEDARDRRLLGQGEVAGSLVRGAPKNELFAYAEESRI